MNPHLKSTHLEHTSDENKTWSWKSFFGLHNGTQSAVFYTGCEHCILQKYVMHYSVVCEAIKHFVLFFSCYYNLKHKNIGKDKHDERIVDQNFVLIQGQNLTIVFKSVINCDFEEITSLKFFLHVFSVLDNCCGTMLKLTVHAKLGSLSCKMSMSQFHRSFFDCCCGFSAWSGTHYWTDYSHRSKHKIATLIIKGLQG